MVPIHRKVSPRLHSSLLTPQHTKRRQNSHPNVVLIRDNKMPSKQPMFNSASVSFSKKKKKKKIRPLLNLPQIIRHQALDWYHDNILWFSLSRPTFTVLTGCDDCPYHSYYWQWQWITKTSEDMSRQMNFENVSFKVSITV